MISCHFISHQIGRDGVGVGMWSLSALALVCPVFAERDDIVNQLCQARGKNWLGFGDFVPNFKVHKRTIRLYMYVPQLDNNVYLNQPSVKIKFR